MKMNFSTILKIVAGLLVVVAIVLFFQRYSTKAHSPEDIVVYQEQSLELEVFYNRPYKKEREIFGGLVPYGEVWRTGANEATTFTTNQDLLVDGSFLASGKYTLWTIPGPESWKVIFNSKMYPWGIDKDKKPYRDPDFDTLILEVPVKEMQDPLEQFSIFFDKGNEMITLNLAWDQTLVSVPIQTKKEAPVALL
ncbi:DUF2911 domain-containing protein [Antarcticibacterium flavum]|uniref:DUF2911 domain-containing protein n=1 Tax=Antarcticibacterium flavum TaxID=2058175 RepID=A0A5B7X276_9FLAO|nr:MULTISPECIES: DUF2911 domain-containing protein [Antarcticibacterium]MCM4160765.1 hypothetical protein [Antarcticibacterium sp. W02-3]QCY68761.1 DUF2911 domain-containing protein [Antarcticibacterium flavum]